MNLYSAVRLSCLARDNGAWAVYDNRVVTGLALMAGDRVERRYVILPSETTTYWPPLH